MKYVKWLLASILISSLAYAANNCTNTDIECYVSGPNPSITTRYRIDASGNLTSAGTIATPQNIIQGVVGTGSSNSASAATSSLSIPIAVSTNVVQGNVIVAASATSGNPTLVAGTYATTNGATTVLGVADAAASSGTVVNVDYSGLGVVLTTGTVSWEISWFRRAASLTLAD